MRPTPPEPIDLSERGGMKDGQPQKLDARLFMQFLAFTNCTQIKPVTDALAAGGLECVVYENVNDARGIGVLTIAEDPALFVTTLRSVINGPTMKSLEILPQFTMLGRTYALGYEPDLKEALFDRPRRTLMNEAWPWAVWYPLRRKGEFAQLPDDQQREILGEHGRIGFAFGAADHGHDVRLACHGLDTNDNDFVIGLIGKQLHPLSMLVQTMRKTKQTSLYLEKLGPFFVGRAAWRPGAKK